MSSWQSAEVEANGLRLHYTRTGGDKPPLVLTHGFSDDGLCWTPVARALEGDYDVIMVDARGHGQSQAASQNYSDVDLGHDLASVITALGLRRPAVLGHSMGAATALAMAGAHPQVPGLILLEDPPARWIAHAAAVPADQAWQARMLDWITGLQSKTREQLIAAQQAETPGWSEDELGPWADSKLRLSLTVLQRGTPPVIDWPTLVSGITCPALLITADTAKRAIVSAADAAALQQLIPQLRVAHIANAGHSIRRDQFDRYMQVVRDFLSETYRAS
ncbi:MAG: alpha/beta hydrolase [Roseiflexaceae bacterium]